MPQNRWLPWLFAGPALLLVAVFLLYPTLQTIRYSFHDGSIVNPTREFVGFDNYAKLFTRDRFFLDNIEISASLLPPRIQAVIDQPVEGTLINTAVWLLLFPTFTVGIGLLMAVLTDKVRYEPIVKSIIFLPMVISATAASVIFRFVYSPEPEIGVLNAALSTTIPGFEPIAWLGRTDIANLAVIFAAVWIWTGLAMVVISAAYKALPAEVSESARVDGANSWQMFWRVQLPMMAGPISFVLVTTVVVALKMVDLVLVMTRDGSPRGATRIIGFMVFRELFGNAEVGYASTVAIVLFIMIIPFMYFQVRRMRATESTDGTGFRGMRFSLTASQKLAVFSALLPFLLIAHVLPGAYGSLPYFNPAALIGGVIATWLAARTLRKEQKDRITTILMGAALVFGIFHIINGFGAFIDLSTLIEAG
jgi:alpha-glucoside transport system permease protein